MHAKNGKIHANGKIIQPKKLFMCHALPEDTDLQCPQIFQPAYWRLAKVKIFGAQMFNCKLNLILLLNCHGFILTPLGWRLSPAYDMNHNEMGNGLTLNISENSNELDISLALETAHLYQLKSDRAESILKEMCNAISN